MSNSTGIEEELQNASAKEPERPELEKSEPEQPESKKADPKGAEEAPEEKPEKNGPEDVAEADAGSETDTDSEAGTDTEKDAGSGPDEEDEPSGTAPVVGKKTPAEPDEPRRRFSLDGRLVPVLVLFVLTASLVGSAFLWRAWSSAEEELQTQQQVRTRSAEFARAFLLYEDTELDGWEQRLTALAAPDYRSAIGNAVKIQFPLITQLQADSKVTVRETFVNDFDGTVAKAMVVADTQITSKEFVRNVTGMRLLVELTLVKGEWLASGVGVLGIDEESMTDDKGNEVDPEKLELPDVAPSTAPSGTP
ncbi:hypothetical protein [Actinocorallia aurantiaca]|uniref:Mce-associated membrane protein n=1 Tax=Actinocorallia aurantiaca TaxID=46204 RepID=A0ABN3UGU7_9ACTN